MGQVPPTDQIQVVRKVCLRSDVGLKEYLFAAHGLVETDEPLGTGFLTS